MPRNRDYDDYDDERRPRRRDRRPDRSIRKRPKRRRRDEEEEGRRYPKSYYEREDPWIPIDPTLIYYGVLLLVIGLAAYFVTTSPAGRTLGLYGGFLIFFSGVFWTFMLALKNGEGMVALVICYSWMYFIVQYERYGKSLAWQLFGVIVYIVAWKYGPTK